MAQESSAYKVAPLTIEWAARVWPQLEGHIGRALRRGGLEKAYQPCDVLADALLGACLIWAVTREQKIVAAIVTRRVDYRRCSTLFVSLIGGAEMKGWRPLAEETIETYAKNLGCVALEGGNRRGWARWPGWKVTGFTMQKDLRDG